MAKGAPTGVVLSAVLLAGIPGADASEILASSDGVTIRAEATPVSQVLDELAKQAGVKVIYDGPPPQDPVTVDRQSPTLAEAIPALLEGLGLSYVLKMDDTGTKVETIFLAGRASSGAISAVPAGPATARAERMRQLLEQRRVQIEEQAAPADDFVEEPAVPLDEEEGPPPDSFAEIVAGVQEAAPGEEAPEDPGPAAAPAGPISPASPFTPSPFDPPPPASSPDSQR